MATGASEKKNRNTFYFLGTLRMNKRTGANERQNENLFSFFSNVAHACNIAAVNSARKLYRKL
jgi:hypothetical protein